MTIDSGVFREPDACFAHPRLAAVYDIVDGARDDLDLYLGVAEEFAGTDGRRRGSVLDVGCGTGALATALAERGYNVIGLDPAAASLTVAGAKGHADAVRWIRGTVADLPSSIEVDLVTMTGNVAQVFTSDEQWLANLTGIRSALPTGGSLVFETRVPSMQAWDTWTKERTYGRHELADGETLDNWIEVTSVDLPLVSFRTHYHFRPAQGQDMRLTSDSTLRFRSRQEITAGLAATGFEVDDVRDAPDRPGQEMIFVARSI